MRFPPQFLDELRARLAVSEVVGTRVRLKKAGREWKGLSPFNKERSPSFFVNDQKGFYHDFSSGKHGDIFTFIMETEGVTFPEAVERLAAIAGLALPKTTPEAQAEAGRRRTLHEVIELAAKFFEASLAARSGAKARGYLADRRLDAATLAKFRIGYAPHERFALKEHLGGLGISVEDMIEAGLLVAGDDIPVPYDRFRNRVMFPIADLGGRVVAFGGRALDKEAPAKYLNSPETPLFHKGAMLYNGAAARQAAHQGAPVIAVEGYVDVIAMVTAGYAATVAPLGTALTGDQLALLWKMADEPILCFDGDAAGIRAAHRAIELALPYLKPGKSLLFAALPAGQDPDDLVRSGGRSAVAEVVSAARPLAEIFWSRELENGRFDTPERRARLEARINELTGLIADETVRRYYREELRGRLRDLGRPPPRPAGGGWNGRPTTRAGARGSAWLADNRPLASRGMEKAGRKAAAMAPSVLCRPSSILQASSILRMSRGSLPPREALILLAALNHPWLLEAEAEQLAELEFLSSDADTLRRVVLDITGQDKTQVHSAHGPEGSEQHSERSAQKHSDAHFTADALRQAVVARECGAVLARIEAAVTHLADWPARVGAATEDVRQWWNHVLALHRKNRTLNKELKEAERALGEELSEPNFARLRDVREQLLALDGTEASIEGFGAFSGRQPREL
jgi:DNA primase